MNLAFVGPAVAGALLAGGSYLMPALVVNHRDAPVELRYSSEPVVHEDGKVSCYLEEVPQIAPVEALGRTLDIRQLQPAQFTHQAGTCEYQVTLPARHVAYFSRNTICSHNWERHAACVSKPEFIYLRISTDSGSIEWQGWEVSRALAKHGRSDTDGFCAIDLG